jgi:outer membrane usher protein
MLWLLVAAVSSAQAGLLTALQSEFMPAIVRLEINGQAAGDAVVALQDGEGQWWLPANALIAARVALAGSRHRQLEDADYVAVASLEPERLAFDQVQQALALSLPPSRFSASTFSAHAARGHAKTNASHPAGAFVNYDLFVDHSDFGSGRSAFTEAGMALGNGVALASFAFVRQPSMNANVRLDTSYMSDQPDNMTSLRIGDAISRPPTSIGRPLRFAGLQFGSNFLTQPGLVTMPVPTLYGQAALPSTVDLYVNNVLQSRHAASPGPFSVTTAPLMAGDGELLLKVTDLSGREQVISQRYYASTVLLAPGLSDWSIEAGALRLNYGLLSNDYGDWFVSGGWRRGLNERLTVEGGASAQQGSRVGLLAGLSTAIPALGAASLALGASHNELGNGVQAALGIERRTREHALALRTQLASKPYRQTGVPDPLQLRRLDTVFYGYRLADVGSISLSWTRQERDGQQPLRIAQLGFSTRATRWGSLMLTLTELGGASHDRSLNLFWILPMESGKSASVLHSHRDGGLDQTVFQFQKTPTPGEGVGYRLQAGINAPQQATVTAQNLHGLLRAEAAEFQGNSALRAGISGSLVLMEGSVFAVRRVDSSFGLVRLPGLTGVRVYVDNQLAGRTDDKGVALLPRLAPYLKNRVSVESLDLPLDVQFDALKAEPVPAWRSGVTIDFPLRKVSAATLNLMLVSGQPVPAGAELLLEGSDPADSVPVGLKGLVYVSGLKAFNRLLVSWPQGTCVVEIPYAPETGSIPYLGEFICEQSKGDKR